MKRLYLASLILAAIAVGSFWTAWKVSQEDPVSEALTAQAVAAFQATATAAEAGDRNAQTRLGDLFRIGKGTQRDFAQAKKWYEEAARHGSPEGQFHLGMMHLKGEGTKPDYLKAADLLRSAANQGQDREARFELGRLYFRGRGVMQDYGKAIDLYRQAAEQDHLGAQYLLGTMQEEGWGVKEDLVEAYKWYTLAARDAAAVRAIDPKFDPEAARVRLAQRMSRFQVEKAEQLVRDWRPR